MLTILLGIAICWLLCGLFAYAAMFAFYQREFPELAEREYFADLVYALGFVPFGPLAWLTVVTNDRFRHGFKWI